MITRPKGASRVVGVQLREAKLQLIEGSVLSVEASFALVRDDDYLVGKFTKGVWSDKAGELLHKLLEQLEKDAADDLFEAQPEEIAKEPEQM